MIQVVIGLLLVIGLYILLQKFANSEESQFSNKKEKKHYCPHCKSSDVRINVMTDERYKAEYRRKYSFYIPMSHCLNCGQFVSTDMLFKWVCPQCKIGSSESVYSVCPECSHSQHSTFQRRFFSFLFKNNK